MDTNKKIIVAIVAIVLTGLLIFTFRGYIFKDSLSTGEIGEGLEFDSPDIDLKKLDHSTKKELYDESHAYDKDRYDSLADNLSFLQRMKKKLLKEETVKEEVPNVDEDLQMLMALQSSLNDPNAQPDINYPTPVATPEPEKKLPKEGDYFFGASLSTNPSPGENLIPAETIDQGVFKQGTTIALRTKQPIILPKQNIKIPKGAVIYGVVRIENTRLSININKYKRDNKLYSIDMDVYDYDGVQGIHLDHRSIFSIPSNVSKDVYRAAMQTYEQQPILGSRDRREPLDRVAILSAAKEISRELFDNRKVFVPRKYHLWLTLNEEYNDK
ncbi:conjugative transposon protein TraM [Abyssalbus ytuae]|uniref:Conjugative transposon protein TraM n=1 Tax=Abyssalbus ytuae TaxID=2926907 RepID=A0A9E7CYH6_9FLAO|nr:conjugative transposon protein TraM [Abyssalbus ytuae]UOB16660.1 conjugative transposon protein TraM [Abyssalbus ytuae]